MTDEDLHPNSGRQRLQTEICLDRDSYVFTVSEIEDDRERYMLQWLHDDSADVAMLLDWLAGNHIVVLPQEEPFMAILKSVPAVDGPYQSAIWQILIKRVAEAVDWLSGDEKARSEISPGVWSELMSLLTRLTNSEVLSTPIVNLEACFYTKGGTPFSEKHCRRAFTQLVRKHQQDNRLEERWVDLIEGKPDPVLDASLFESFRGLLSMPEPVGYLAYRSCIGAFCRRVDRARKSFEEKRDELDQYYQMIWREFPKHHALHRMTEVAVARHWSSYPWINRPDELVEVIAWSDDQAELAELKKTDRQEHWELAEFIYETIWKDTLAGKRKRSSRQSRSPMVAGTYKNYESFCNWRRSVSQTPPTSEGDSGEDKWLMMHRKRISKRKAKRSRLRTG